MGKKALVAHANNNILSINRPSIDFYSELSSSPIYLYAFLKGNLRSVVRQLSNWSESWGCQEL